FVFDFIGLNWVLETAFIRSFVAQRLHRIDFGGPTRRDVARKKRNATEQQRDGDKRQGIGRSHSEEQRGKKARQSQRASDTENDSDRRDDHSPLQYVSQDIAALSS